MLRTLYIALLLAVLLAACAPSQPPTGDVVATAVQLTIAAQPSPTQQPQPTAQRITLATTEAIAALTRTPTPVPTPTFMPTPPLSCAEEHPELVDALDNAVDEFSDALDIMLSVSKLAVAGPIADMQDVQRSVEKLNAPTCGVTAQLAVADYMDAEITFWLKVLADEYPPGNKSEMRKDREAIEEKSEIALEAIQALHIK